MACGMGLDGVLMRKLLALLLIVLFAILGVSAYRTATFERPSAAVAPVEGMRLDDAALAKRLAGALRFRTISAQDPAQFDAAPFRALQQYLAETFPAVHAKLQREIVNDYSLLYTWPGSDPSLKAVLLLAHQDVVPVTPETEKDWLHPAFAGEIADGFVWGRGTLDDKSSLMAILEAVEALLNEGYQPKMTIYLAFGHDEEVGGPQGAPKIAETLKARGVRVEYAIDEGETIIKGVIPGVSVPVAVIGLGEKGYLSLELTVDAEGGHAATPPRNTAIGILARAISRIEDHPFPANLEYAAKFFAYVGPEMPLPQRAVFANLWLTAPLVKRIFGGSPPMNAAIRTTTAVTMCSGGIKENVLPARASAVINFRIMPGETVESVTERVKKIVKDDRVKIAALDQPNDPSRISDTNSESYRTIVKTTRETVADLGTVVAPFITLGASDSRHYEAIADNVYRFLPIPTDDEDLERIHGTNERIAIGDYARMVQFYARLIRNSDPGARAFPK